MEDLIDRITQFLSDLPIGLIIFLLAIAFSFFGGDRKKATDDPGRTPQQNEAPRPAMPADDPWTGRGDGQLSSDMPKRRKEDRPAGDFTFASDERRAREERERRQGEVLVFGGLDFGSRGSLFRDEGNDRDSQWGKTKYGFDDSEWGSDAQWGSSFGDRKSSEPVIR